MPWSQNYDPLGSLALSALVAALPAGPLLALRAFWHVRAPVAALAGPLFAMVTAHPVSPMPW
mgnify:CR=1 FL=1